MNNYTHFIGIDISKHTLDVCVLRGTMKVFETRITNDEQGLQTMEKQLHRLGITNKTSLFCCEHTGIYGHKLAVWTVGKTYPLWIESALAIKKSMGLQRGKNDRVDAYRIAQYAARFQDQCRLWQLPSPSMQALQRFMTLRKRLINVQKQLTVPLQETAKNLPKGAQKNLMGCTSASLKGITEDLKKVEKQIDSLIAQDDSLKRMAQLTTSVTGVGKVIALSLIVATNGFTTLRSAAKMACYAGVAPFQHQSGISIRGRNRVSSLANKWLKSLLHMAALSAIQHSEELSAYYQRKVAEGKPKMAVINAVRNKIITRIYACVRDNRLYEKNYTRKLA